MYIEGSYIILNFQIKIAFLSLKIVFVLEKSLNLDEMPQYAVFYLGLHSLLKYTFRSH